MLLQHSAGHILGVGDLTQLQPGHVFLALTAGVVAGAGGVAQQHHQNTGGHGIQRTGVTDLFLPQHAPQLGHHVVRGEALGLVHDQNAVYHFASSSAAAAIKALQASSAGRSTVQPAALG